MARYSISSHFLFNNSQDGFMKKLCREHRISMMTNNLKYFFSETINNQWFLKVLNEIRLEEFQTLNS